MSGFQRYNGNFSNTEQVSLIIEWAKKKSPAFSVTLTNPNNRTSCNVTQDRLNAFIYNLQKVAIGKYALPKLRSQNKNELGAFAVVEPNKVGSGYHIHLIICVPELSYLREEFEPKYHIKEIWKKITFSTNVNVQKYYENDDDGFFGYSTKELRHDDKNLFIYGWLD